MATTLPAADHSRPPRRIVAIEHDPGCPLDRLAYWLDGATIDVVRPYAGDAVPTSADGGLIVLGGQMSAYDDGIAPWLPAVRKLLASSMATGTPTLGICLGAQLLAVACGGRVDVKAAPGREAGVVDLRWRPEAASDPLVRDLPRPSAGPSMHADAIVELPAEATWLAFSDMYPHQVFRVGSAAWGVQFHPEVSLPTFRGWASRAADVDDARVELLTKEFLARDRDVIATGRGLAGRFAALVGATATTPAA
ncbi:MAG: type 1 glutamine amidotransferase [Nocardioidaceae bacterium]